VNTVQIPTRPSDATTDGSPPIVLLAHDQEWSARSLESVLGPHGFASVRAFTGRQALELARRTQPDVIIIDAGMPDIGGIDLCRQLRTDLELPSSTPIVMTTSGAAPRAERLEAYRAGVWEFLSLPVDADALILKLQVFVRAKREIDRSREESLLDTATGLYNVRGLTRRAREIGAEATRRHAPLACVAFAATPANEIELSNTDVLEPWAAEQLGDICRKSARSSDAIGRLGQSEFAIIAPTTDTQGAIRLAKRLRDTIEAADLTIGSMTRRYRVRAGYYAVADFAQSSIDAVEVMLRAAAALRHVRTTPTPLGISAFEDVPGRLVS
jgi:PleD family two-component response regulator